MAEIPADAATITVHLGATISAANCTAMNHLHALRLTPTQASADAIDQAIEPSLGLLRLVVERGDIAAKIVAAHAIADIYQGAAVQMRATGPEGDQFTGRWTQQAQAAYAEAARLGEQIPDRVSTDPVLAFAVSDSKFQLAAR